MPRRLRETGPAVLVPLAWLFVIAAHTGAVRARTLLAAHVVMTVLLVAFVALSWADMDGGALLTWRRVILAGVPVTLAGTAGLSGVAPGVLLPVALYGWMLLPAAGLADTGSRAGRTAPGLTYAAGSVLCLLGAVLYAATTFLVTPSPSPQLGPPPVSALAGLALVGVGQTAGIVAAVVGH